MNVVELSERLTSDPESIIKVLVKLGFDEEKIVYHKHKGMITSVRPEPGADNPYGMLLYTANLHYLFTTRQGEGNIFNLVMKMKNVSFPEALEMVGKWIGFKGSNVQIVRPFGGFYRKLISNEQMLDTDLPTYSEADLPDINSGVSEFFFDDGIAYDTQESFGVRFDHDENCILIPIRNSNGELVGCKARNNDRNCDMSARYWAALPFSKTHVVYGLDHNYPYIIDKDTVILFEAEKSVMQAWSFGCRNAVAVMGHSISKIQTRILKSLMTKKIIVAFDEGLTEAEIKAEARKLLVQSPMYQNQVYYIYGGMNPGSKDSPTDNGKKIFKELIKNNLKRLDCGESER